MDPREHQDHYIMNKLEHVNWGIIGVGDVTEVKRTGFLQDRGFKRGCGHAA